MSIPATRTAIKALAIALLGAGTAVSASASGFEEEFEVAFEYSRAQPVQDTYASFQRVAEDACQPTAPVSLLRVTTPAVQKCAANLVDQAVAETGYAALITYHHDRLIAARAAKANARD